MLRDPHQNDRLWKGTFISHGFTRTLKAPFQRIQVLERSLDFFHMTILCIIFAATLCKVGLMCLHFDAYSGGSLWLPLPVGRDMLQ